MVRHRRGAPPVNHLPPLLIESLWERPALVVSTKGSAVFTSICLWCGNPSGRKRTEGAIEDQIVSCALRLSVSSFLQ